MGFLDFIERQRRKPETVRRRILMVSAVFITTFIFLVWLFTFYSTSPLSSVAEEPRIVEDRGPLSEISVTLDMMVGNIEKVVNSLKSTFAPPLEE